MNANLKAELQEIAQAAPHISLLRVPEDPGGLAILVNQSSGDFAKVEGWVTNMEAPFLHGQPLYSVTLSREYTYGGGLERWGVNIGGMGPWNPVRVGRIAAQMLDAACDEADRRNAAEAVSR